MLARIGNPKEIDKSEIRRLASSSASVTVQFSEPVEDAHLFDQVNDLCEELDDRFCVRFFGHYTQDFDASILRCIPAVKNLELNCLQRAENFHVLRELGHLIRLNIGIFELEESDFLSWSNLHRIRDLCLSETRTNRIDLSALSEFKNLNRLFLNGQNKNIGAISALSASLSDVSLSLSSKTSIAFLSNLPKLKKLRLILGGRANLDEVQSYELEELEINRVRGFDDFKNLKLFTKLKSLIIEDQIRLTSLDFGQRLGQLSSLKLLNCKNLRELHGMESLSSLESLRVYQTALNLEDLLGSDLPHKLKTFAFYSGKRTVDVQIRARLSAMGYSDGLS